VARLDETRTIERQLFFDGQRLFAPDMQGLEAFNREMRWLHNESLHQPGIGNGFAVSGEKGDRQVTIGPGYAIDAQGREIVLIEARQEQVPPVAGKADGSPVFYDLAVAYPADEDLETAETRAGVCQPRGAVRLREEPVFCWVRLTETEAGDLVACDARLGADVESGQKIVLARAEVLNCQLNSVLSVAQRRSARPAKQPYVACGKAELKDLEIVWFVDRELVKDFIAEQLLSAASLNNVAAIGQIGLINGVLLVGPYILPFGIKVTIDTCQANFLTTPCYTARIEGSRSNEIDLTGLEEPPEPPPPDEPPIL
jgi:hypothetical protein